MLQFSFITYFSSLCQGISSIDFSTIASPGSNSYSFIRNKGSFILRSLVCSLMPGYFYSQIKSRIVRRWRATRAAFNLFGRTGRGYYVLCRGLILLFALITITGCHLPGSDPNIPVEPNIIEPNDSQAWNDYSVQWPIRINGKTYIHQMRRRPNGSGVYGQFIKKENEVKK